VADKNTHEGFDDVVYIARSAGAKACSVRRIAAGYSCPLCQLQFYRPCTSAQAIQNARITKARGRLNTSQF